MDVGKISVVCLSDIDLSYIHNILIVLRKCYQSREKKLIDITWIQERWALDGETTL